MKSNNPSAIAARHVARQILDGEFQLMERNQCSVLWHLVCTNFREPGCPQAFVYLQTWLKRWNGNRYGKSTK